MRIVKKLSRKVKNYLLFVAFLTFMAVFYSLQAMAFDAGAHPAVYCFCLVALIGLILLIDELIKDRGDL